MINRREFVTTDMKMQIRLMTAGDIEDAMTLAEGLKTAPQWPRAVYERAVDPATLPQRIALAAEIGGQMAGFAIASVIPPEAELETIAVAADQQRRGVGGELLAALLGALEARRASELTLEVRESNVSAQAFYRAHGFAEFARRPSYYADTGEAAVLMRVRIRDRREME